MKQLTTIAGTCDSSSCPTVYMSDDIAPENVLVQGYIVSGADTPDGETVVEVPVALLEDAVAKMGVATNQ